MNVALERTERITISFAITYLGVNSLVRLRTRTKPGDLWGLLSFSRPDPGKDVDRFVHDALKC